MQISNAAPTPRLSDMEKIRELDEKMRIAREARLALTLLNGVTWVACLTRPTSATLQAQAAVAEVESKEFLERRRKKDEEAVRPFPHALLSSCQQIACNSSLRCLPFTRAWSLQFTRPARHGLFPLLSQRIKAADDLDKRAVKNGLRSHRGGHRLGGGE